MTHMLTFDGFLSAELYEDQETENTFTCAYKLRDMEAMQQYLDGPAKEMRADGINRFGDKMTAARRILRLL